MKTHHCLGCGGVIAAEDLEDMIRYTVNGKTHSLCGGNCLRRYVNRIHLIRRQRRPYGFARSR